MKEMRYVGGNEGYHHDCPRKKDLLNTGLGKVLFILQLDHT